MLDVQLKEHTRREHALLEKKLLDRISAICHVSDYVALLSLLYGYYAAVENRLMIYYENSGVADFPARRRAARILDDMAVYAPGFVAPPLCLRVPEVTSFYSALGVLYVLEGSALGGQIIAKLISTKLNVDSGFSFFLGHGDAVEQKWASFKEILRRPKSPEQAEEALDAAMQTFLTFNYWLSEHE